MAARPGLISRGLTTMASLANPALGAIATAYGAHSAAKNAQASIGAINDAFGTTMDDSYGTAIGQQALGTTSGLLGGKVGEKFGANLGRSVGGVPGAIAGGLLGALGVSSAARDAAMGPAGSNNGPQGPAAGGDGMSNANSSTGQAVASTRKSRPRRGYVSIDNYAMDSSRSPFDRYSDYAAQFFGLHRKQAGRPKRCEDRHSGNALATKWVATISYHLRLETTLPYNAPQQPLGLFRFRGTC